MIKTIAALLLAAVVPAQNVSVTADPGVLPFTSHYTTWHEFTVGIEYGRTIVRGRITTLDQDMFDGFNIVGVRRLQPSIALVPWLEVDPLFAAPFGTSLENTWPTYFNQVCHLPLTLPPCTFFLQTVYYTPWWSPWCVHPLEIGCSTRAWTPILTVRAW